MKATQSAVSAAVSALEQRHDVTLFNRVGRRIELTDVGRMFLSEARGVLARATSAELALFEFGGLKRGSLRIVTSQTIGSYWLPGHLAAYHRKYPLITATVTIANTDEAARTVHDGEADVGLIEGEIDNPALSISPIDRDQMEIVSAKPMKKADIAWLEREPWVMREPGSGTRSTLEDGLRAIGVKVERLVVALAMPSNEAVRTAVEQGVGISALSSLVVDRALQTKALYRIPIQLPDRPFFVLRHKERYQSKAVLEFLYVARSKHRGH